MERTFAIIKPDAVAAHYTGRIIQRIEAIQPEDVQQVSKEFFQPESIAVTVLGNLNGLKLSRDLLAC